MIKSIFQIASLTLLTLVSIILPAQELTHTDHCGTVLYNRQLETDHPEIGKAREAFHRQLDAYLASMPHEKRSPKEVITIPVVVHVVWNTAEQNIPDEQVWSQFFVLNEDFRRLNPDTIHTPAMFKPVAADCGIEFCMARRTPDSLPASGIVRVHTDTVQFPMDNTVKSAYAGGSKAWDAKRYLNIWVCHMAGNILGYAQMPGGPDSTDGVVIDYRVFGKVGTLNPHYNLGRTTTHEIGHWLDLYHIWGDDGGSCDGTDYVDDTPNAADANYYCPSQPHLSACNDTGEMFMNYMDYIWFMWMIPVSISLLTVSATACWLPLTHTGRSFSPAKDVTQVPV
ncbi:MAG: zinc metalloprotease [Bacteroidetes bacterium]|nr:zinc metalloprotease [Bacteroidota bacterium]